MKLTKFTRSNVNGHSNERTEWREKQNCESERMIINAKNYQRRLDKGLKIPLIAHGAHKTAMHKQQKTWANWAIQFSFNYLHFGKILIVSLVWIHECQ